MSWLSKTLLTVSVLVATTINSANPAIAHASLQESYPKNNSQITQEIQNIELLWNEEIETTPELIKVYKEDNPVEIEKIEIKKSSVNIKLKNPTTPGSYQINWKVLSKDSHLVSGVLNFTYQSKGTVSKATALPLDKLAKSIKPITWIIFIILLAFILIGKRSKILPGLLTITALTQSILLLTYLKLPIDKAVTFVPEIKAQALLAASPLLLFLKKPYIPLIALFSFTGFFSGHHLTADKMKLVATTTHILHLGAVALWTSAVLAVLISKETIVIKKASRISLIAVSVLLPTAIVQLYILATPFELNNWTYLVAIKLSLITVALLLGLGNNIKVRQAKPIARMSVKAETTILLLVFIISSVITQNPPPNLTNREVVFQDVNKRESAESLEKVSKDIVMVNNISKLMVKITDLCSDCDSTWDIGKDFEEAVIEFKNDKNTFAQSFNQNPFIIKIPNGTWQLKLVLINGFTEEEFYGELENI